MSARLPRCTRLPTQANARYSARWPAQFLDKITDYKNENPETYNIFNRAANLFINKLKLIDEAVTEYSKDVVKTFDCALEAIDKCTNLINKKYEDKFNELNSPE